MQKVIYRVRTISLILLQLYISSACSPAIVTAPTPTASPQTQLPPATLQPGKCVFRFELSATSDYANFDIYQPEYVLSFDLVSISGDPTFNDFNENGVALNQELESAEAGETIGITVDYEFTEAACVDMLDFKLQSGALNGSSVRVSQLVDDEYLLLREEEYRRSASIDGKMDLDFTLDLTEEAQADATTPSYRVQFNISTTADRTSFNLVSGGKWYDLSVVSINGNIEDSGVKENRIFLVPSPNPENVEQRSEIIVDAQLVNLDPEEPLFFEIDNSDRGVTQVEILKYEGETPTLLTTLVWDGLKHVGFDLQGGQWVSELYHTPKQVFEVSTQPFQGSSPNEYAVIAQMNLWYHGPGEYGGFENPDGSRNTPLTPLYGYTYNVYDPVWMYQQIEWAVEYGVDAFSIEWQTPNDGTVCCSTEDPLENSFLRAPNIHKVRWVIFYDFPGRIGLTTSLGVDTSKPLNFNQPEVYDTFVNDVVRLAELYFDHPQYLTIDGRPVFYVWATKYYQGDLAGAIAEARTRVSEIGYDIYFVGDEVCYNCFNPEHAALFDGSSAFTFLIRGVSMEGWEDLGDAVESTDMAFDYWSNRINGLQVIGREEFVNFQPAWAPQYDESWIKNRSNPRIILAGSADQVHDMAEMARGYAEPAGAEGLRYIWVNTWNCWGETTTIEPTIEEEPQFAGGNYGFDFLEIIREVYGIETFYTSP
jgi:hypothetical protein